MNKLYDNGMQLIGPVYLIKKHTINNKEYFTTEEYNEVMSNLIVYNDNDILMIDYDNPMCTKYYRWMTGDSFKVKEQ